MQFPALMPPTLITRDLAEIKAFRAEHGDIVMKPLYGHGGGAVFRLTKDDLNFGSLYDMFAATFREPWVVQQFLPAVAKGDKRIMLVDGAFAGAVNRVPAADDLRSNMVRGGSPKETDLTPRERDICAAIGPALRERGLILVGIDVIDGMLTEINVTSPTGIRAIKNLGGPDVAALTWDAIEKKRGRALVRRAERFPAIHKEAEPAAARLEVLDLPDQVLDIGRCRLGVNAGQPGVVQLGFDGFDVDHGRFP